MFIGYDIYYTPNPNEQYPENNRLPEFEKLEYNMPGNPVPMHEWGDHQYLLLPIL